MQVNLTAWLLMLGGGAVISAVWFFLSCRRKFTAKKAALLSLLTLFLGIVLAAACARLVWVLCRINTRPSLFPLRYDELSYYGGVAGVVLAVALAAKITGLGAREALNAFAPMGALMAAVARFGEGFLGFLGFGAYMEQGIFFPVTVEIVYDEYYSEFYLAVFMLEGLFALVAMVLSIRHNAEKNRALRTLFYLCLPQVFCESLRMQSINWLFVRVEQLGCFLFCEAVLVWYAFRADRHSFRSWIPALTGLPVCGLIVACEFALDGKITIGNSTIPHWITYAVMIAGLALLAVMEHRGRALRRHASV